MKREIHRLQSISDTNGRHRNRREKQERGIVGETPNLAARLQALADPDTVVIAESTGKLLGGLFDLENVGTREVRGIGEPVRAYLGTTAKRGREPLRGTAWGSTDRSRREGRRT